MSDQVVQSALFSVRVPLRTAQIRSKFNRMCEELMTYFWNQSCCGLAFGHYEHLAIVARGLEITTVWAFIRFLGKHRSWGTKCNSHHKCKKDFPKLQKLSQCGSRERRLSFLHFFVEVHRLYRVCDRFSRSQFRARYLSWTDERAVVSSVRCIWTPVQRQFWYEWPTLHGLHYLHDAKDVYDSVSKFVIVLLKMGLPLGATTPSVSIKLLRAAQEPSSFMQLLIPFWRMQTVSSRRKPLLHRSTPNFPFGSGLSCNKRVWICRPWFSKCWRWEVPHHSDNSPEQCFFKHALNLLYRSSGTNCETSAK